MNLENISYIDYPFRHWEMSKIKEVTGVPTLAKNGLRLVGAQSFEYLTNFIDQIGAEKRR